MYCPRLKMNCSYCIGSFTDDRMSTRTCTLCSSTTDKISSCPLHSNQSMCDTVRSRIAEMLKRKVDEYQIMTTLVKEFQGKIFICVGSDPKFLVRLSDNLYYDTSGCYNYNDLAVDEVSNIFLWDHYQMIFPQKARRIVQQIS